MTIKIEEFYNRLTILLMNSESYSHLYDWLDLDEEELLNDIKTYVELDEGVISKEELENQIDDGLMSLMDYYEDNWMVFVYDEEGNEENLLLHFLLTKNSLLHTFLHFLLSYCTSKKISLSFLLFYIFCFFVKKKVENFIFKF